MSEAVVRLDQDAAMSSGPPVSVPTPASASSGLVRPDPQKRARDDVMDAECLEVLDDVEVEYPVDVEIELERVLVESRNKTLNFVSERATKTGTYPVCEEPLYEFDVVDDMPEQDYWHYDDTSGRSYLMRWSSQRGRKSSGSLIVLDCGRSWTVPGTSE